MGDVGAPVWICRRASVSARAIRAQRPLEKSRAGSIRKAASNLGGQRPPQSALAWFFCFVFFLNSLTRQLEESTRRTAGRQTDTERCITSWPPPSSSLRSEALTCEGERQRSQLERRKKRSLWRLRLLNCTDISFFLWHFFSISSVLLQQFRLKTFCSIARRLVLPAEARVLGVEALVFLSGS